MPMVLTQEVRHVASVREPYPRGIDDSHIVSCSGEKRVLEADAHLRLLLPWRRKRWPGGRICKKLNWDMV